MAKKIDIAGKMQGRGIFFEDNGDITNDSKENNSSDSITDNESVNTNDSETVITSDTDSYINSDINITLKKQAKYTDLHVRKTYYILKTHFKKMQQLEKKYNLDKSFIINEALKYYFDMLEKSKKAKE